MVQGPVVVASDESRWHWQYGRTTKPLKVHLLSQPMTEHCFRLRVQIPTYTKSCHIYTRQASARYLDTRLTDVVNINGIYVY